MRSNKSLQRVREKQLRTPLIAVLLCVAIAGCAKKQESTASAPAQDQARTAGSPGRYMAYEHFITLDVEEARVASIHKAAETACQQAVAEQCVILQSQLDTGRNVYATIMLRAKPEGIAKLIASLSTQGKVVHQTVTAEDLAEPIDDSAKKLEMLNNYRTNLEALRAKASSDIDALIKVNKDLAQLRVKSRLHPGSVHI